MGPRENDPRDNHLKLSGPIAASSFLYHPRPIYSAKTLWCLQEARIFTLGSSFRHPILPEQLNVSLVTTIKLVSGMKTKAGLYFRGNTRLEFSLKVLELKKKKIPDKPVT